ncbi:MAG: lysylphosphatidylglycerol synthase transmembrane domain-containing protein [Candidatus Ranarchaeia archaeon]
MERRTTILITIVSVIALVFWLQITIGLDLIALTLLTINPIFLIPPFAIFGISYLIRTYRWNVLLKTFKNETEGLRLFPILCGGTWMNLIIPFKIAELIRPMWLNDHDMYSFPQATASILIERFLDFAILILLPVTMTLSLFSQNISLVQSQITSSILILLAFVGFLIIIRSDKFLSFAIKLLSKTFKHSENLKDKAPQFAEELALGMRKMLTPRRALPALLLTLIIWFLESSKLMFLANAIGMPYLPLEIALITGSLSYVGGHALIIPSGLGIFISQTAIFTLLFPTSLTQIQATSIALLDVIVYVSALTITGAPSIIARGKKTKTNKENK